MVQGPHLEESYKAACDVCILVRSEWRKEVRYGMRLPGPSVFRCFVPCGVLDLHLLRSRLSACLDEAAEQWHGSKQNSVLVSQCLACKLSDMGGTSTDASPRFALKHEHPETCHRTISCQGSN